MAKKIYLSFFICLMLFISIPSLSFAESSHVLPYPSYMPGNFLYKPRLIISELSRFIYFGDFGKFNYNLKESDHYLVEAKTLFEYKQYLLALNALSKSDVYFQRIRPSLENARSNGKNISEKEAVLKETSIKHMEVLGRLEKQLPGDFNWSPENEESSYLDLRKIIEESINIRNSVL